MLVSLDSQAEIVERNLLPAHHNQIPKVQQGW